MRWIFAIAAAGVLATGCARPTAVRQLAVTAQPDVANLQRAALLASENMSMQRRNLARSTADYEALRRDQTARVAELKLRWEDAERASDVDRLSRLQGGDVELRANPYASLQDAAPQPAAAGVRIQTQGLAAVAQALDRLKGKQGLTPRDLIGFAAEVRTEIEKIEKERESEAPADPAS